MPTLRDTLIKAENIINEVVDVELNKLKTLKIKKELEIETRVNLSEEVTKLKEDIETTKESSDFIQLQLNLFNKKYIDRIEKLINKALAYVFYDENYKAKLEIKDKKLELLLEDKTKELTKPLSKIGGGIRIVISVFLQIFFIIERNLEKLLLLDESLYAVSEAYRERFYNFLKIHSKENNFHLLIISHDERTEKYMDNVITIN